MIERFRIIRESFLEFSEAWNEEISQTFTREEMVIIFATIIQEEATASAGRTDSSQVRAKKLLDINPRLLQTLL
jgi:hypothetical protein